MRISDWSSDVCSSDLLLAVAQHDGVLADQVDAADMAVEIDAHARPVEAGGDLPDMGRLAGPMVTLNHDAAVVGKSGHDGEEGLAGEGGGRIEIRQLIGERERVVGGKGVTHQV